MRELNLQEVNDVSGGDAAGLGQAMMGGGGILLAAAALMPGVGLAMYGVAWGIGGAIMWGRTQFD